MKSSEPLTQTGECVFKLHPTLHLILSQAHKDGSVQSDVHIEIVVTRIMHVFVDALPHVPEHRRLPILSQLLGTLGPSHFLWVLMLLMFEQHVTQTSVNATGPEKVRKVFICCFMDISILLKALTVVLCSGVCCGERSRLLDLSVL